MVVPWLFGSFSYCLYANLTEYVLEKVVLPTDKFEIERANFNVKHRENNVTGP